MSTKLKQTVTMSPKTTIVEYELTEIDQTPKQKVLGMYMFLLADVNKGLDYGVDKDLVNEHLEIAGSDECVTESIKASKYLEMIYALRDNLKEGGDKDEEPNSNEVEA